MVGRGHSPMDGFFSYGSLRAQPLRPIRLYRGEYMDKDSKEALQVTKELVAKFIETRNISPGNFAEVFPAIYKVVLTTIADTPAPKE